MERGAQVLRRIQATLDEANVDCAILASPPNVYYASGADVLTSKLIASKPTIVIVPRAGESTLVVVEWDADAVRQDSDIPSVRPYPDDAAFQAVADVVHEQGLETGVVGVEETFLSAAAYRQLGALLPGAELVPCDQLMREVRLIKTASEIALLRHAATSTEKAIYATFVTARPGDTEKQLADTISHHLRGFGAEIPFVPMLTAGVNSTVVHLLPSEKRIMHGEIIHVDTFETFAGYWSDVSRNASVGQPTAEQQSMYSRLWEIQQRVIEHMTVGTRVSELFQLYQDLSEQHDLPTPISTLGHGIGVELHELPEIDREHDLELRANMVLSVEPTTIIPGDARYDIEDTILITADGPEVLSNWHSAEEMFVIE